MREIETLERVRFGPGVTLGLNDIQAKDCAYAITRLSAGVYETKLPVEFKGGEVFGYDGPLTRAMRNIVVVDGVPPETPPPAPVVKMPVKARGRR